MWDAEKGEKRRGLSRCQVSRPQEDAVKRQDVRKTIKGVSSYCRRCEGEAGIKGRGKVMGDKRETKNIMKKKTMKRQRKITKKIKKVAKIKKTTKKKLRINEIMRSKKEQNLGQ